MKKLIVASALGAVLASSVVASSNLQLFGGYNYADSKCVFDDTPVAGINVESFFNDNLGVRMGYERGLDADLRKGTSISSGKPDTAFNRFSANLVVQKARPWHRISPYILAGGGYEAYDDVILGANKVSRCGGQTFLDVGLGAKIALSSHFALRPEVRGIFKEKCDTVDVVPTLGIEYAFGVAAPKKPRAPKIVYKDKIVTKEVIKEVPVEKIVTVEVPAPAPAVMPLASCPVPKNLHDRCDNSYYVQVASALKCADCDKGLRNKALTNKLDKLDYTYKTVATTNKRGTHMDRLLVGPYKCKKDAFKALCKLKKVIACDAFVYSYRGK